MHLLPLPRPALTVCHYALSLALSLFLRVSPCLTLSIPQAWIITSKACAGMDCLSCTLSLSACCSLPVCLSVCLSLCPSGMVSNIKGLCRHGPSVMYALTLSCSLHVAPCLSLSLSVRQAWIITSKDSCRRRIPPASVCLPIFSTVGNQ